jgi:uncharacterized membrane protein
VADKHTSAVSASTSTAAAALMTSDLCCLRVKGTAQRSWLGRAWGATSMVGAAIAARSAIVVPEAVSPRLWPNVQQNQPSGAQCTMHS